MDRDCENPMVIDNLWRDLDEIDKEEHEEMEEAAYIRADEEYDDSVWACYVNKQRNAVKRDPDIAKIRRASASLKWFMRKLKKEEKENAKVVI